MDDHTWACWKLHWIFSTSKHFPLQWSGWLLRILRYFQIFYQTRWQLQSSFLRPQTELCDLTLVLTSSLEHWTKCFMLKHDKPWTNCWVMLWVILDCINGNEMLGCIILFITRNGMRNLLVLVKFIIGCPTFFTWLYSILLVWVLSYLTRCTFWPKFNNQDKNSLQI